MSSNLAGNYYLSGNIDCSATSSWNSGQGFVPVGGSSTPFTGKFDGKGYKITGLYFNRSGTSYQGLFGYLSGATVENVGLESLYIRGDDYIGGLAGYLKNSTVNNSYVVGNIVADDYIGGFGGVAQNSDISSCYSQGAVTSSGGSNDFAGGLIGKIYEGSSIIGSYSSSTMKGVNYLGGLVSYATDSTVTNSYATGNIGTSSSKAGFYSGGLIGYTSNVTINNSNATGIIYADDYIGGLVGSAVTTTIKESYATGAVTSIGGGEIDCAGGLVGQLYTSSSIINSYATGAVSGTGFRIGGLVGRTDSSSISGSHATGNVRGDDYFGGLVGEAQKTSITNSYATGNLTCTGSGDDYAGGLVGKISNSPSSISGSYATGSITCSGFYDGGLAGMAYNTTITNSYATGNVRADDFLGGLVGEISGTTISGSYAEGSITCSGSGEDKAGGLVGKIYNGASITNSFAKGSISCSGSYDGGLVGQITGTTTITNTYAIGDINGSSSVGGLIGSGSSTVVSSYWDIQTSGLTTSSGGTGKTTAQMKKESTFTNWDFENVWCMIDDVYYPSLYYFGNCKPTCTGCAVLSGSVCVAGNSCSGEHPNCVVTDNDGVCECSSSSCAAGRSCSASGTCTDCESSDGCGACACGTSQKPTGTGTCMNDSSCCAGECNMATGANSCSYSDSLCPSGVACNRSTLSCCALTLPYWRSSECRACSATSGLSGNCTTKGMMCNSSYDCVNCFANMQCTCDDGFVADGAGGCIEPVCFDDGDCGVDKCINAAHYDAFCSNCSASSKVWVDGTCESCPSGSSYHSGICLCIDGKIWNSSSNTCSKKSVISSHGVIDTKSTSTAETPESRYDRIKRKMNRITSSAYAGVADKESE
ncbi:MAG: GLUG motif-containing protein [Alphaproteobacteria bacterium]